MLFFIVLKGKGGTHDSVENTGRVENTLGA